MRVVVFPLLLAVLPGVFAFDTSSLPSCGKSCLTKVLSTQTSCSSTDDSCICLNEQLSYNIGYCWGSSCSASDQSTSLLWLENACTNEAFSSLGINPTSFLSQFTADPTLFFSQLTATATAAHATGTNYYYTSSSHSGLSTGAKVGLGVSIPLILLILAGGVIFAIILVNKRRKRKNTTPPPPLAAANTTQPANNPSVPPGGGFYDEKTGAMPPATTAGNVYGYQQQGYQQQPPLQQAPPPAGAPMQGQYMPYRPPGQQQGGMMPPSAPAYTQPQDAISEMPVPINSPPPYGQYQQPTGSTGVPPVSSPVSAISQPHQSPTPQTAQVYEAPGSYSQPGHPLHHGNISELPGR